MKLNTEPIKNWFGFTRRERRASFILLLIIVSVLAVRTMIPEKNIETEDITSLMPRQAAGATSDIIKANDTERAKTSRFYSGRNRSDSIKKGRVFYKKPQKTIIDLNNCDTALLKSLPGIGPVLSVRIIKYRNLLGGFVSVSQLKEVYGLPAETFDLIKGRVSADSSVVVRIKINSAGYKELSKIPYFQKYEVSAILKYRELKGRVEGITDLTSNKLIPPETAVKVRPYLSFE